MIPFETAPDYIMQTKKRLTFYDIIGIGCCIAGFWCGFKIAYSWLAYSWLATYLAPFFYFGWKRVWQEDLSVVSREGKWFLFSNGENIFIGDIPYFGTFIFILEALVGLGIAAILICLIQRIFLKFLGIKILEDYLPSIKKTCNSNNSKNT